jgi:hypothetical protein
MLASLYAVVTIWLLYIVTVFCQKGTRDSAGFSDGRKHGCTKICRIVFILYYYRIYSPYWGLILDMDRGRNEGRGEGGGMQTVMRE